MLLKRVAFLLVACIGITACGLFPDQHDTIPWKPDVVAPLGNLWIDINDLNEFDSGKFSQIIPSPDVGYSGTVPSVPAFSGKNAGPYTLSVSNEFQLIDTDSLRMTIIIDNHMPIDIGSGTTFELKNHTTNSILYTYTLPTNVAAGASHLFTIKLYDVSVDSDVDFKLVTYNSPGSSSPVDFTNSYMEFKFHIGFLAINKVVTQHGASFTYVDTYDYNTFDNLEVHNSEGFLKLMISNGFPMEGDLQMYFLDANHIPIDSLFDSITPGYIPPAYESGGVVTAQRDTTYYFPFDPARVENISKTDYVRVARSFRTPDVNKSYTITKNNRTYLWAIIQGNIDVLHP